MRAVVQPLVDVKKAVAAVKSAQATPKIPTPNKPVAKAKAPAQVPIPVPTGKTGVPTFDTMSQELVRKLFSQVTATPRVLYSFQKGSDGLLYWIESTAPPGWLETIVGMRRGMVAAMSKVPVAPNGTISRLDDKRISENEFKSICKVLNQKTVSSIASIDGGDTGFYGVCSSQNNRVPQCGAGCLCLLTSKDYTGDKGWRKENITYLIHELAHAALSGPDEAVAHNIEFFRVQHILTTAAMAVGPGVYDPGWYRWDPSTPGVRDGLGSQIGTTPWWNIQKQILVNEKKHWTPNLENGPDVVPPPDVTGVNISINSPGA